MTHPALSAEARQLIGAPHGQPIERQLNWSKLLSLAQHEGATAALWQRLQHLPADVVPRDVASNWQKLAMIAEFQMLQLQRTLHDVLNLLTAKGFTVMLLKGSALAHTAYESFADRPMGDLDLLLPSQARRAWSLLQQHGWRWDAARWPAERYAAHQHLPPLIHTRGSSPVLEIHSALLPSEHPFRWSPQDVWDQARTLTVAGRTVLVPQPLHQLLHVCVHFAWSHEMKWGGWRALRDVAAITRTSAITWDRFVDLARDSRAATCCFWTLRLARNLIGARVPQEVLRALRPPRPEFLLKRLEYHYVRQLFATERDCPSEALDRALWTFGIAPQWSRHGAARPWHGAADWTPAAPPAARRSLGVLSQARHAVAALGYLGRITATRFPRPA